MAITGERTVPGVWHENYWFRRHEVVYASLRDVVRGQIVLEAGCGEGYGAHLLSRDAARVHALDYDGYAVDHVRAAYPAVPVIRGNLASLPVADRSYDVVVSLQTVEHMWDQEAFVAECVRALRPGGTLVVSTPNALTFPPGNAYHPHELDATELHALVARHARVSSLRGLHHGPGLAAWEARHGPLVDAQVAGPPDSWPDFVRARVASVTCADFELAEGAARPVETSLDLVLVAVRAG